MLQIIATASFLFVCLILLPVLYEIQEFFESRKRDKQKGRPEVRHENRNRNRKKAS